jgi:hypothetical protein
LILSSTIWKISVAGQWYFFSLNESRENSTNRKKVSDMIRKDSSFLKGDAASVITTVVKRVGEWSAFRLSLILFSFVFGWNWRNKTVWFIVQLTWDLFLTELLTSLICNNEKGKEYYVTWDCFVDEILLCRRVLPTVQPGYIRDMIPAAAPELGEPWQVIFQDIERVIMPGVINHVLIRCKIDSLLMNFSFVFRSLTGILLISMLIFRLAILGRLF